MLSHSTVWSTLVIPCLQTTWSTGMLCLLFLEVRQLCICAFMCVHTMPSFPRGLRLVQQALWPSAVTPAPALIIVTIALFWDFLKNYVYRCFACIYALYLKCEVPTETRKGHWIPRTRITDGCEPPGGCWESNQGLWKNSASPIIIVVFAH